MKKIILLFILTLFLTLSITLKVEAQDLNIPDPLGYVNDFANILSKNAVNQLETQLSQFEKRTSHEIAVVTIESLQETTIEDFAEQLFQKWGIGKKNYDNGILLLIAPNERKLRIEVGYGLEGIMPDLKAKKIINNIIVPEFKNDNYDQGVIAGVEAIEKVIQGEVVDFQEERNRGLDWGTIFVIVFFAFYIGYVLFAVLGRSKRWWPGGVILGSGGLVYVLIAGIALLGAVFIIGGLAFLGFVLDYLFSKYGIGKDIFEGGKRRTRRRFWWFGSGGGSFGGGFGGFGGGSSGGGGASGSW